MAVAFGKYELLRKLATGGMGQIFLARPQGSPGLSRLLVVKRLLPHLATDRGFLHMFLDEAKIASRLDHPNIVRIHEMGQFQGSHFLAMEYVAGEDLRTLGDFAAAVGKPMPLGVALRVVADAALGLHHAHQATDGKGRPLGLVHRDVSPPNILVGFDGTTKLIDFGVAKAAGRLQETATGFLKGKYPYMSPEQIDARPVDQRSDVFSLGVILWELCTRQRLFKGSNELTTARLVSDCSVPPPVRVNRELPKELDRVVLKALQRNRDLRYPDAAAFRAAIEQLLATLGLSGTPRDVAAYLHELYADRIAAEQDESRQDVLWGALDEERSSATLPPPDQEDDDEADTTANPGAEDPSSEETLPADGAQVRFVAAGTGAPHTTSMAAVPESPRWRRLAAVAAAVLLLGGATTAAALYARARHHAAEGAAPRER
ncbi:MAG TPA: serine/threonine-protein kinase [Myxococcales bacterium]|nr:serine/threonine-protein kinase [Myxococcales bacterium]